MFEKGEDGALAALGHLITAGLFAGGEPEGKAGMGIDLGGQEGEGVCLEEEPAWPT